MSEAVALRRPWLRPIPNTDQSGAERILLCFPYGGGEAGSFHDFLFPRELSLETWGVAFPGRGERIREPLPASIEIIINAIATELREVKVPFLFYGHSFGAGLALEVAHALLAHDGPLPSKLVLSGRMPPHAGYAPFLTRMTDEELWSHICSESPMPVPLKITSSFAQHTLRKLRFDLELNHALKYERMNPLSIPLSIINGMDDPLIELERLEEWRAYTSSSFESHVMDGGHFFFRKDFNRFSFILKSIFAR